MLPQIASWTDPLTQTRTWRTLNTALQSLPSLGSSNNNKPLWKWKFTSWRWNVYISTDLLNVENEEPRRQNHIHHRLTTLPEHTHVKMFTGVRLANKAVCFLSYECLVVFTQRTHLNCRNRKNLWIQRSTDILHSLGFLHDLNCFLHAFITFGDISWTILKAVLSTYQNVLPTVISVAYLNNSSNKKTFSNPLYSKLVPLRMLLWSYSEDVLCASACAWVCALFYLSMASSLLEVCWT